MKKNKNILLILVFCMTVSFISRCSTLVTSTVATINESYDLNANVGSIQGFSPEKQNTIKIKYDIKDEEGAIGVKLVDPSGNTVEEFEISKKGSKDVSVEEAGEYELHTVLDSFKGKVKIYVSR